MGQSHFAKVPRINIPRSMFDMSYGISTSFNHGKLVPLDAIEILPGDTFTMKIASVIRMSTPIAPLFGNIHCMIHAFFVPNRLVWEHFEEFMGANKTSAGPQLATFNIPQRSLFKSGVTTNSISAYLGKPLCTSDSTKAGNGYGMASVLKERGYALIYNEYYRAEQLQNPVPVYTGDNDLITVGDTVTTASDLFTVCKMFDYFTSQTLQPQFGAAVELPLGTFAPVITTANDILDPTENYNKLHFRSAMTGETISGGNNTLITVGTGSATGTQATAGAVYTSQTYSGNGLLPSNLIADLTTATAAKVNDVRYAFQLQKYLERSNFGGNRFFEILNVHYGVTSPDSRLQRPEYLGGTSFMINVNQVVQTTGWVSGQTSELGNVGAVSVTGNKSGLLNKGFVEPGYLFIMLETKHERSYSQGIMREDFKSDRFEFYSPEFANLGDQATKRKEITMLGSANDEDTFGVQEHWAEYRYRPNRVSGLLNPSASGSLDYWTLAEKFDLSKPPSFDGDFIKEDRTCISRCLSSGNSGPDYIGDFWIDLKVMREMPVYTIPGLIDHFGAM